MTGNPHAAGSPIRKGAATALWASLLAAATLVGGGCAGHRKAVSTAHVGRDTVTEGVSTRRAMAGTGASTANDDNRSSADMGPGAGVSNPCTLVTQARAQAILGTQIDTPQEAPQGPTCIYQPHNTGHSSVTLTVEAIDLSKVKGQMRHRKQIQLAGHSAYCGDYGQPMTFVALPHGRVLNVTAPCSVSTRFAVAALAHLKL